MYTDINSSKHDVMLAIRSLDGGYVLLDTGRGVLANRSKNLFRDLHARPANPDSRGDSIMLLPRMLIIVKGCSS